MSHKELLFSVTAADCKWDFYRASGKGGQKVNKTSSAVRCTHKESGAVGRCQDTRFQAKNKTIAFRRMIDSDKFKSWLKIKISRAAGVEALVEAKVDRLMHPSNLKIEFKDENNKWTDTISVQD